MYLVLINGQAGQNSWPLYITIEIEENSTISNINNKLGGMSIGIHDTESKLLSDDQTFNQLYSLSTFHVLVFQPLEQKASWTNIDNPPLDFSFPISSLICGRLTTDYEKFLKDQNTCSDISGKIANSMIRVAATRIFADPTQSILELPVNSVDSYRKLRSSDAPSVGKFGMGFFSILYWVLSDSKVILLIKSQTRNDKPWNLLIYNVNDNLQCKFILDANLSLHSQEHISCGTTMTLMYMKSQKQFNNLMPEFIRQLYKLRYIDDVRIELIDQYNRTNNTITNNSSHDIVKITLMAEEITDKSGKSKKYYHGIRVKDRASGIPLNVLFGSLLIPTISTKTIESSQNQRGSDLQFKTFVTCGSAQETRLTITVGLVVVVDVVNKSNDNLVYRIDLPIWSKLPVSRDDVVIELGSYEYEMIYQSFIQIVDECLSQGYDLQTYFQTLHQYANHSTQEQLQHIIRMVFGYVHEKQDVIFLPNKDVIFALDATVNNPTRKYTFARMRGPSITQTLKQIESVWTQASNIIFDDSFDTVIVVVLPQYDGPPTNGGLPGYLFLRSSDYNRNNWQNILIDTYDKQFLQLHTEQENSEKWELKLIYRHYRAGRQELTSKRYWMVLGGDKEYVIRSYEGNKLDLKAVELKTNLPSMKNFLGQILKYFPWDQIYAMVDSYERTNFSNGGTVGNSGESFVFMQNLIVYYYRFWPENLFEYIKQLQLFFSSYRCDKFGIPEIKHKYYGSYPYNKWLYDEPSDNDDKNNNQINYILNKISIDNRHRIAQSLIDLLWIQLDEDNYLTSGYPSISDGRYMFIDYIYYMYLEGLEKDDIVRISNYLLSHMSSAFEGHVLFMTIVYYFRWYVNGKITRAFYQSRTSEQFLQYIMLESRTQFNPDFYRRWRDSIYNDQTYRDQYEQTFFRSMTARLHMFTGRSESTLQIRKPLRLLTSNYSFNANQLIDYIFTAKVNTIHNRQQLIQLLIAVSNHSTNNQLQFQSVSIAVNEGTSKPFISSVLTELLQNSIDAIRSNIESVEQRIDIDLIREETGNLRLSMVDFVGIPDSSILALLIPFLSSKSTTDMMSTGEMGTGFFNVYRQPYTSHVLIHTGDIIIKAQPISNNGRVIDIRYDCSLVSDIFKGTRIYIILQNMSFTDEINFIVDCGDTARLLSNLSPFPTYFNDVPGKNERELVFDNDYLAVYITPEIMPSYVLTNGVPFGHLIPLADKTIDGFQEANNYPLYMNVIVDIHKGHYIPSQSRHSIRGTDADLLLGGLWYAMGYKFLKPEWHKTAGLYIHDMYNRRNVAEYNNYEPNSGLPFVKILCQGTYINNWFGEKTLVHTGQIDEIINERGFLGESGYPLYVYFKFMILYYQDNQDYEPSRIHTNAILDDGRFYDHSRLPKINQPIARQLIVNFISDKGKYKSITKSSRKGEEKLENDVKQIDKIMTRFAQVYYDIGSNLKINGVSFKDIAPPVIAKDMNRNYDGYYIESEHVIHINDNDLNRYYTGLIVSWNKITQYYRENERTAMNRYIYTSPWAKYIANTTKSATLIHELQHSILHTSHEGGESHRPTEIDDQIRTYDEGCKYVYDKILGAGFWDKMLGDDMDSLS